MTKFRAATATAALMLPAICLNSAHAQSPDAPYHSPACSMHVTPAPANVADDPDLDPAVREFLVQLDKNSSPLNSSPFWKLLQPKPQEILTALQDKYSGRHVGRDHN